MINVPIKVIGAGPIKAVAINAPEIIDELKDGGVSMPDIVQVIFNISPSKSVAKRDKDNNLVIDPKTKKPVREVVRSTPMLATTIYFGDGSKVTVTNSENDSIFDKDGKIMPEAYERGVVYAIVKRIFSRYDVDAKTGETILKSEGFGHILREIVDGAYNQPAELIKRKEAKDAARAEHRRLQEVAKTKPKRKRVSLAETVDALATTVDNLQKIVNSKMDATSTPVKVDSKAKKTSRSTKAKTK